MLMGWTLPSTGMWRGEVFAISDCLVVNVLMQVSWVDSIHMLHLTWESCSMCNGYGIWINKDKLRWSLITFNWLHEPWRASPESWHLSRYYYIHSSISFIQVDNISWELAPKPGYYTIIVQYTSILFVRGITAFRAQRTLARGRHPLSALFRISPGVHTPVGHRVAGISPKASLASGNIYTSALLKHPRPTG